MENYSYHPVHFTSDLQKHGTKNTIFALVIEKVCFKYTSEANAEHFLNALQKKYSITVDRKGEKYTGTSLKWDYIQRTITLSMPEYVKKALHKFQHTLPTTPEYTPHAHVAPTYG